MEMAYQYLAIYILGYLAVYLYCYFTAVLRSFGNSVFQVIAMLICTLLNAGLDPLFIHFFGFNGAAAATVLSQILCLIFMMIYLYRKRLFHFRLSCFDKQLIPSFIKKGIPSAFQQSIPAVSTSFLTSLVTGYGISALAAYGITGKLETILFYPAMALNMALTSIVGQCTGGRRYDRHQRPPQGYALAPGRLLLSVFLDCYLHCHLYPTPQMVAILSPQPAAVSLARMRRMCSATTELSPSLSQPHTDS